MYELSDDPKRKEFLDELFAFMQKRGTPVNRIPIMAKHVLDLYELYKLVVAKGGLVEVINKKLWREITKGLNLPSSITSAAFTLRTQYMKYLYPYENEKLHLSTQAELNAAIDGNKREGRRPVYGYDHYPSPGLNTSINGSGMSQPGVKSNDLLNAAALGHHSASLSSLPTSAPHGLMQHHFLAAAAAAGLLAHHPSNHRLFDPSTASHQMQPNPSSMNPFIKQLYGEITPPSSSSSSSSSSTSSSSHRDPNDSTTTHFNNENLATKSNLENENSLIATRRSSIQSTASSVSHLKRPFEHLDQNLDHKKALLNGFPSGGDLKESASKKQAIEQQLNINKSSNEQSTQQQQQFMSSASSSNSNSSSKMKIKILSKSKFFNFFLLFFINFV